MPIRRNLFAAIVAATFLGAAGPAIAGTGAAATPSDAQSTTGDLPPIPYNGPVVKLDGQRLVFFNAVALGDRFSDVRKRHPELHFEQAGYQWIAMSPIGKHALTLTATANKQDRVIMITVANIKTTEAASLAAHIARHLGKPWHDVNDTATSDQWENSAIRQFGTMPPNTRMSLISDTSDGLAQIMAFHVDRKGVVISQ